MRTIVLNMSAAYRPRESLAGDDGHSVSASAAGMIAYTRSNCVLKQTISNIEYQNLTNSAPSDCVAPDSYIFASTDNSAIKRKAALYTEDRVASQWGSRGSFLQVPAQRLGLSDSTRTTLASNT